MNTYSIITRLIVGFMFSLVLNSAQAVNPAQAPLSIGISATTPNIMLMVDDSGSMGTNVSVTTTINSPDDMPAGTTYTCSTAISYPTNAGAATAAAATVITNMTVTSSGSLKFCTNATCSKTSSFSTSKCFNNTKYYNVKYYNGASLGTFIGLKLNWYFKTGKFVAGSLAAPTFTVTKTRLAIAKEATTNLVNSLIPATGENPKVRLGLATYNADTANGGNGSGGGMLLSEITTLDATHAATITTAVNNLVASGNTPLATTLADIGRYFTIGYTGNLTLHPTTTKVSAPLDTVFNNGATTPVSDSIFNNTGNSSLAIPVQNFCQKNFVILVSDGLPNGDRKISSVLRDYTGDCATKNLCDATPNSLSLPGASGVPLNATGTTCKATTVNGVVTIPNDWYYKACQNGTKAGRIYETGGSDYLDDVAQALYEMDLRPNLIKTKIGEKNNLATYAIGLADPSLQTDSVLNSAAQLGGGKFYFAGDAKVLAESFDDILSDISTKVSSSSSIAANSSKLDNGAAVYQGKFDTGDWIGNFISFPIASSEDINKNGILDAGEDTNNNNILDAGDVQTLAWDAATRIPAHGSRVIYTYNPTASPKGVSFSCANLTAAQKTALGIASCATTDTGVWRLNWLRGDVSHELINPLRPTESPDTQRSTSSSVALFRNRTHLDRTTGAVISPDPWVLGDIVNSDAVFVSDENYGFDKLPASASEKSSYQAFVTANANRHEMIYVGANDGMLHGFDARLTAPTGTGVAGAEIFAYIPNDIYDGFLNLSSPSYAHQYFVDGAPRAGDAYFGDAWHTVLLGSTGAGGHAVFALDITDPLNFAGSHVLWEISDMNSPVATDNSTDTTTLRGFAKNMGYTLPQASVGKMHDGSWAAIVANGYGSENNLAVLYIINIQTGAIIRAIDTKAGSETAPNGLSTPFAADIDGDKVIDVIYAGDLQGNMWKFDVSSATATNWGVAYGTSSVPAPLFIACSNSASCDTTRQPITAKPQVGKAGTTQYTGVMVYFGTGKYFEESDNVLANSQTQTMYGIWDNGATVTASNLQAQTILLEVTQQTYDLRVTSKNPVNYPTQKGWYMNLLKPSIGSTSDGERMISTPLLRNGRIIFVTLTPIPPAATEQCSAGSDGTSWLMEMDALSGARFADTGGGAAFDITGNGIIDAADLVAVVRAADGSITGGSTASPGTTSLSDMGSGSSGAAVAAASGKKSKVGAVKTPGVISQGKIEYKYTSGSKEGAIEKTAERGSGGSSTPGSRQSWQQLQ